MSGPPSRDDGAPAAPSVLTNLRGQPPARSAAGGAVWRLQEQPRHLDANIIHLPPGDRIDAHPGPDLDVLVIITAGGGLMITASGPVTIGEADVIWLPRRGVRGFIASDEGLTYLTVHPRRGPLTVGRPDPA